MTSCNGLLIGRRVKSVSRIVTVYLYLTSHLSKYSILQNGGVWRGRPLIDKRKLNQLPNKIIERHLLAC